MHDMIYLDNAASSRLDERVLEAMRPYYFDTYAVATSQFGYSAGVEAKDALDRARSGLAAALGAQPEEIVFTSGSTESSNMALKGVAMALGEKRGKHVITTRIEDFAVLNSARSLEKLGFRVTYLDVDEFGRMDMDQLRSAIVVTTRTTIPCVAHRRVISPTKRCASWRESPMKTSSITSVSSKRARLSSSQRSSLSPSRSRRSRVRTRW